MFSGKQLRAFSVHILTAFGSFLALLALTAAAEERWDMMFVWLGVAYFVDGIDGPLARKLNVKEVLPNWSGVMLDNVIDYVTFVLIPAYALYGSGLLPEAWSFVAAGVIVVSSAIYYADTGMKTDENFFSGFPVVWTMVVFSFFVIMPPVWVTLTITFVLALLSFAPVWFLHPVRVKRLRPLNLAVVALYTLFAVVALWNGLDPAGVELAEPDRIAVDAAASDRIGPIVQWGTALTSLYLLVIGGVLQAVPSLGRK